MPRFTLDKFTARKFTTQVSKDKFVHLKPLWLDTRKSQQTDGSIVLWDPPRDLCDGICAALIHELGFTRDRQKTGIPFLTMTERVEKLKAYSKEQFMGSPLEASKSDEQS